MNKKSFAIAVLLIAVLLPTSSCSGCEPDQVNEADQFAGAPTGDRLSTMNQGQEEVEQSRDEWLPPESPEDWNPLDFERAIELSKNYDTFITVTKDAFLEPMPELREVEGGFKRYWWEHKSVSGVWVWLRVSWTGEIYSSGVSRQ